MWMVLRAAQARFAEDRATMSPQGVLRFELWRGPKRVRADGLQLALTAQARDETRIRTTYQ